jgi:hypothetical protein
VGADHHDLPKALASARERGFHPGIEHLEWLIETMADVHRDNSFRYLTSDGDLIVADEAHSLRILDDLVAEVGLLLYPEHNRAYWLERLTAFDGEQS